MAARLIILLSLLATQVLTGPIEDAVDDAIEGIKANPYFRDIYLIPQLSTSFVFQNEEGDTMQGTLNFTAVVVHGFKYNLRRVNPVTRDRDQGGDNLKVYNLDLIVDQLNFSADVRASLAGQERTYLTFADTSDIKLEVELRLQNGVLDPQVKFVRGFNFLQLRTQQQILPKLASILESSAFEGFNRYLRNVNNRLITALIPAIRNWDAVKEVLIAN
ncbi:hypothetical protein HDE_01502 [Halotydeus destructor]|nr:hypothetical protein HDE_01502 [Halotydeus destructor]